MFSLTSFKLLPSADTEKISVSARQNSTSTSHSPRKDPNTARRFCLVFSLKTTHTDSVPIMAKTLTTVTRELRSEGLSSEGGGEPLSSLSRPPRQFKVTGKIVDVVLLLLIAIGVLVGAPRKLASTTATRKIERRKQALPQISCFRVVNR